MEIELYSNIKYLYLKKDIIHCIELHIIPD